MSNKLPPIGSEIEVYLPLSNIWVKAKVTEHKESRHPNVNYFLTDLSEIPYLLDQKDTYWRFIRSNLIAFEQVLTRLLPDPPERLTEALIELPDDVLSDLLQWIK